jgi:hypothetical protein
LFESDGSSLFLIRIIFLKLPSQICCNAYFTKSIVFPEPTAPNNNFILISLFCNKSKASFCSKFFGFIISVFDFFNLTLADGEVAKGDSSILVLCQLLFLLLVSIITQGIVVYSTFMYSFQSNFNSISDLVS